MVAALFAGSVSAQRKKPGKHAKTAKRPIEHMERRARNRKAAAGNAQIFQDSYGENRKSYFELYEPPWDVLGNNLTRISFSLSERDVSSVSLEKLQPEKLRLLLEVATAAASSDEYRQIERISEASRKKNLWNFELGKIDDLGRIERSKRTRLSTLIENAGRIVYRRETLARVIDRSIRQHLGATEVRLETRSSIWIRISNAEAKSIRKAIRDAAFHDSSAFWKFVRQQESYAIAVRRLNENGWRGGLAKAHVVSLADTDLTNDRVREIVPAERLSDAKSGESIRELHERLDPDVPLVVLGHFDGHSIGRRRKISVSSLAQIAQNRRVIVIACSTVDIRGVPPFPLMTNPINTFYATSWLMRYVSVEAQKAYLQSTPRGPFGWLKRMVWPTAPATEESTMKDVIESLNSRVGSDAVVMNSGLLLVRALV